MQWLQSQNSSKALILLVLHRKQDQMLKSSKRCSCFDNLCGFCLRPVAIIFIPPSRTYNWECDGASLWMQSCIIIEEVHGDPIIISRTAETAPFPYLGPTKTQLAPQDCLPFTHCRSCATQAQTFHHPWYQYAYKALSSQPQLSRTRRNNRGSTDWGRAWEHYIPCP